MIQLITKEQIPVYFRTVGLVFPNKSYNIITDELIMKGGSTSSQEQVNFLGLLDILLTFDVLRFGTFGKLL